MYRYLVQWLLNCRVCEMCIELLYSRCLTGVFVAVRHQDHLVKQGMKADQAASLVEQTAARCSTVKYDVELAEEYIARQVTVRSLIAILKSFWFLDFIFTFNF